MKSLLLILLLWFFSFSTAFTQTAGKQTVPEMPQITASNMEAPPDWALMERQLMETIEKATPYYLDRFTRRDGTVIGEGPYDDVYEMFFNWPDFYAIGGDEMFINEAIDKYDAITRTNTVYYEDQIDYHHRLYKEYPRHDDFFHISEGMTLFYNLALGDPTLPGNHDRAQRFAGFYLNEDPEAQNYDFEHKVLKSIFTGSEGPLKSSDATYNLRYGHASLYPVIEDLDPDWHEDPERKEEIQQIYDRVVTRCDVPVNLMATGLMTNAYLYTGDEKYKQWVLDYADAWLARIEANDGILPDNVGQTGQIGEYRDGQWWGGLYGWTGRYGIQMIFGSLSVASECAYLLSGDPKYLDLVRSQLKMLIENGKYTDDGQLLVPYRYNQDGWFSYRPMMIRDAAHLWHASYEEADWELAQKIIEGNKFHPLADEGVWGQNTLDHLAQPTWEKGEPLDKSKEMVLGDRTRGKSEFARLLYYAGENPDWPYQALKADMQEVIKRMHFMQNDPRDIKSIEGDDLYPNNPVIIKALHQVTMGTPQTLYNGGLLRATVRYFNANRQRPGLPEDVSALVEKLDPEGATVHLVNLNTTETRDLIIQAGAFGEHKFSDVTYSVFSKDDDGEKIENREKASINGKFVKITLPPSHSIILDFTMDRHVNDPGYAFPWHEGKVPVR